MKIIPRKNMLRKVIVIGLDGSAWGIIKQWIAQNELPAFKKLIDEGVYGDLESTIPWGTIPAWPSFMTGVNPGKHNFFDFLKEKDNGYEPAVELLPSKAIRCPTLWNILSDHGYRVGVINVPGTYPPSKVNGYMITGMLSAPGRNFTYPGSFQSELKESIGEYEVFPSQLTSKDVEVLLNNLEKTLAQRVEAFNYLYGKKNLDFIMMVDNGTDMVEHECFRFCDPQNPLYSKDDLARYGNPVLKYYKKVDEFLGTLMGIVDEKTILFLMSDHGQQSLHKFININAFLLAEGFMKVKSSFKSKARYFLYTRDFTPKRTYQILRRFGIERLALNTVSPKARVSLLNTLFFSASDIDWENTKAFGSGVSGGLRINVKGREPNGCVSPGREYEQVRNELIEELSNLRDPENKQHVVGKVYKREEIYSGPYVENGPDLVATETGPYKFFGMYNFTFKNSIEKISSIGISGKHSKYGMFLAYGAGIKKRREISNASILDITPTILSIFGIDPPGYMDGGVLDI